MIYLTIFVALLYIGSITLALVTAYTMNRDRTAYLEMRDLYKKERAELKSLKAQCGAIIDARGDELGIKIIAAIDRLAEAQHAQDEHK